MLLIQVVPYSNLSFVCVVAAETVYVSILFQITGTLRTVFPDEVLGVEYRGAFWDRVRVV